MAEAFCRKERKGFDNMEIVEVREGVPEGEKEKHIDLMAEYFVNEDHLDNTLGRPGLVDFELMADYTLVVILLHKSLLVTENARFR